MSWIGDTLPTVVLVKSSTVVQIQERFSVVEVSRATSRKYTICKIGLSLVADRRREVIKSSRISEHRTAPKQASTGLVEKIDLRAKFSKTVRFSGRKFKKSADMGYKKNHSEAKNSAKKRASLGP
ncbi:hypothetical protein L596_001033 [Steinernema carpocapsae]|uniref:Uncharacterized protein n=1 Tax=Steinernema carpocapsae TaxID=34508 RepID=A0A4U8UK39_STECR|nr:hypothetical protein L596_001033 [Steinernema carpocapsae]